MVEGMHLVAMRQMRLMCGRQNFPGLVKPGGFAVVPGRVLMMFGRKLMEFAHRFHGESLLPFSSPTDGSGRRGRNLCSAGYYLSPAISHGDNETGDRENPPDISLVWGEPVMKCRSP